jgi:hypothetical protein
MQVSALDVQGRTIRIADAHGNGKHLIARADETPTAFVELQKDDTRVRGEFDLAITASPSCQLARVLVVCAHVVLHFVR